MNGLEKEHGHTHVGLYVQAMAKWLAVALVTGVCCGVVGSLFHIGVERATELREQHPWLLWCLPAAGLVIVAFYKLTKTEGQGTNDIIDAVHHGKPLSIWLLPAIFLGTILTHLCGGSAGREGAALQMGGTIGRHAGNLFNLDDRDLRTATMAGMAAFFSALFGTPLTATVFAIVVISIGVVYHVAFIPCLTASLVAYWISVELGVAPTRFSVAAPELEKLMLLRVAVLGVGCALVSVLLCRTLHFAEHQMKKRLPNAWLRVLVGGGAVIGLVLGRDGEHAVLYIQIDVLLAEAGQVGLEQVVGALVPDISAEDRRAAAALAEHAALQLVKQIHHAAVAAAGVGDHIHKSKLLSVPGGASSGPGLSELWLYYSEGL